MVDSLIEVQVPPQQATAESNRYMETSSDISLFTDFLLDNFAGANSKNLCANCWCLCNRYQ